MVGEWGGLIVWLVQAYLRLWDRKRESANSSTALEVYSDGVGVRILVVSVAPLPTNVARVRLLVIMLSV